MTDQEKRETISGEVALEGKKKLLEEEGNTRKEERLEEATRMKRTWQQGDEKESEGEEMKDVEEEDFLGQESPQKLCFTCCMTTCICIVRELEKKIEMLKIKKEVEALEAEIRASSGPEQGRGRKKRRLDENEEETEAIGTPNKKKKPEHELQEKTQIPPPPSA